jgi:hypothetical protein
MAKKVKTLFMAGYKGKHNVPFFVGEDGTQYSPDDYHAMCNDSRFEEVQSLTAVKMFSDKQVNLSESTLGPAWKKVENYKPDYRRRRIHETDKRYTQPASEPLHERLISAYESLGLSHAEAELLTVNEGEVLYAAWATAVMNPNMKGNG